MSKHSVRAALCLSCLLALGGAVTPLISAALAPAHQVVIRGFRFEPASTTIQPGESVTWINKDEEPHTVMSDSGVFRSPALDTGERFGYSFDKPGVYHFTCSIHPHMQGTIIVRAGTGTSHPESAGSDWGADGARAGK